MDFFDQRFNSKPFPIYFFLSFFECVYYYSSFSELRLNVKFQVFYERLLDLKNLWLIKFDQIRFFVIKQNTIHCCLNVFPRKLKKMKQEKSFNVISGDSCVFTQIEMRNRGKILIKHDDFFLNFVENH